jgi:hypothetical protein
MYRTVVACICAALLSAAAHTQTAPAATPSQQIQRSFDNVAQRVLTMAKDFPENKYSFRATPEVRSYHEVIVHIMSGFIYGAKKGRGEDVKWDEVDAKLYKTKAEVVAALERAISDADTTLKATPESRYRETVQPWLAVIEHSGEHYGQLVVYYRINGLVPPESRPKK